MRYQGQAAKSWLGYELSFQGAFCLNAIALTEGRSRKHETDIYDMMVHHYLGLDPEVSKSLDETNIDRQAEKMGSDTLHLWESIKGAAQEESRSH
jgi:hypothetical protein